MKVSVESDLQNDSIVLRLFNASLFRCLLGAKLIRLTRGTVSLDKEFLMHNKCFKLPFAIVIIATAFPAYAQNSQSFSFDSFGADSSSTGSATPGQGCPAALPTLSYTATDTSKFKADHSCAVSINSDPALEPWTDACAAAGCNPAVLIGYNTVQNDDGSWTSFCLGSTICSPTHN